MAEVAATWVHAVRAGLGASLSASSGLNANQGGFSVPAGQQVVVTVDTLVCDVHFTLARGAASAGHKSLAVNLSDLAAMGAEPRWASLVLSLPGTLPSGWLEGFGEGLRQLAERTPLEVIAVELQPGPLTITIQAWGLVPAGAALLRSAATPGDLIMVTGTLGDAALALRLGSAAGSEASAAAFLARRLDRPEPRNAFGIALRGLAHGAIDVSDGLLADLGHILERSGCGATLQLKQLPISAPARLMADADTALDCALRGGDDYELCFTLPAHCETEVRRRAGELGLPVTVIGVIEPEPGLRAEAPDGSLRTLPVSGWDHFRW